MQKHWIHLNWIHRHMIKQVSSSRPHLKTGSIHLKGHGEKNNRLESFVCRICWVQTMECRFLSSANNKLSWLPYQQDWRYWTQFLQTKKRETGGLTLEYQKISKKSPSKKSELWETKSFRIKTETIILSLWSVTKGQSWWDIGTSQRLVLLARKKRQARCNGIGHRPNPRHN